MSLRQRQIAATLILVAIATGFYFGSNGFWISPTEQPYTPTAHYALKLEKECIELPTLMNYSTQWEEGNVNIITFMQKIGEWKTGNCG